MDIDDLTEQVIGLAIAIHRRVGPGAFESAYEKFMLLGLSRRGFRVERQVIIPVEFEGDVVELGYRVDLLVDDQLFVELKCTERSSPVHQKQRLTYLRVSGREVGLLINFGMPRAMDGVTRVVNDYKPSGGRER